MILKRCTLTKPESSFRSKYISFIHGEKRKQKLVSQRSIQGGTGIGKKDPSTGLTNYVIRHRSIYSNYIKLRSKSLQTHRAGYA